MRAWRRGGVGSEHKVSRSCSRKVVIPRDHAVSRCWHMHRVWARGVVALRFSASAAASGPKEHCWRGGRGVAMRTARAGSTTSCQNLACTFHTHVAGVVTCGVSWHIVR